MRALPFRPVAATLLAAALAGMAAGPHVAAFTGAIASQTSPPVGSDLDRLLGESSQAFEARDAARGRAILLDVRERARDAKLPLLEAEALRRLARAEETAGEVATAAAMLDEALALFEAAGARGGAGLTLLQRGMLSRSAGDVSRAIDLFKAIDDQPNLLRAYAAIVYYLERGPGKDRVRAEALEAARRAPTRDAECNIVHQWGDELFNTGRFAESLARLTEALTCFQGTSDRSREGRVLVSLGRLHRAHGRLTQALDHYVRALALQEAVHDEGAAVIIRNDETLTSYLALRPDAATPEGDGHLTADEVYALALDADLVVLSACRTALGRTGGDGVIGFIRAFLYAGAASVIATMWDVPDRTTYEVMRSFYTRRGAGRSKSRALRAAQLAVLDGLRRGALRAGGAVLPEHPRFWAGFVLVGEPD